MDALILAAGMGKRMLPLTNTTPKPLLPIGSTSLMEQQINQLVEAGITHIVITLHHLGKQIFNKIGNGERWNISIEYSWEKELLNTGSGILHALPKISSQQFLVVNSDIYTDYPYHNLLNLHLSGFGHLVLVPTPQDTAADFSLSRTIISHVHNGKYNYIFSGISLLDKKLFMQNTENVFAHHQQPLASIFNKAIAAKQLFGEYYKGYWIDAGTHANYAILKKVIDR